MRVGLLLVSMTALSAQPIPVGQGEPSGYRFDGRTNEWQSIDAVDLVALTRGARTGRIWLRQTAEGLLVAGQVLGGAPDFPVSSATLLSKDHVEIWLADAADPQLPPIGWGNQFGMIDDKSENDCPQIVSSRTDRPEKECREWFRAVPGYRQRFQRLFLRQFLLAPQVALEEYASRAYQAVLAGNARNDTTALAVLEPGAKASFRAEPLPNGYSFEALIPWSAYPPLSSLTFNRMRVMVDVLGAHEGRPADQPVASISKQRRFGVPSTFRVAAFQSPRQFHVSRCHYPLQGLDIYREPQPAWFFPRPADPVDFVFILQNTARGYLYEPGGLSPVVRTTHFFERQLGADEAVCGPALAWRRNGTTTFYRDTVDPPGFEVRRSTAGSLLVKSGPHVWFSEFGSGMCGACPRISLGITRLHAGGRLDQLLRVYSTIDQGSLHDADFVVSPDWSRITIYRAAGDDGQQWTAETQCLGADGFRVCDFRRDVTPPRPRIFEPNK